MTSTHAWHLRHDCRLHSELSCARHLLTTRTSHSPCQAAGSAYTVTNAKPRTRHFKRPHSGLSRCAYAGAILCSGHQAGIFLSYQHLAAVFKAETGQTMQQYHTARKMQEACRLLKSSTLSIGDIAQAVGFADLLYFSRRFHAVIGMSPTQYRSHVTAQFSP